MRLGDNPEDRLRSPRFFRKSLLLVLTLMLLAAAAAMAMSPAQAQSGNGVYDSDGDLLIEIDNLEQLDAVRYDRNGNGIPERHGSEPAHPLSPSAMAYAAAFPTGPHEEVCDHGCNGYELARSLDFDDPASYASGAVNPAWTEGGEGRYAIDRFRATFDGNGNTISSLRGGGLFGSIYYPAVITRIGLTDAEVWGGILVDFANYGGTISHSYSSGSAGSGGLVGRNLTGRDADNRERKGLVTHSHSTATASGGGLVFLNEGIITHSYATGDVTGGDFAGGLVGRSTGSHMGGTISYSYATGNVTGNDYVGGLVGEGVPGTDGAISHSYATGDVTGGEFVGGLIGRGSASHSYATGDVTGRRDWVGGLVGSAPGDIIACYATGNVTGGGLGGIGVGYSAGGLVGATHGSIIASYATGNVTNAKGLGGLVGRTESAQFGVDDIRVGGVQASYAIGRVWRGGWMGAFIGGPGVAMEDPISDSYWDVDIFTTGIGGGDHPGARGLTTAHLQSPTGYTGVYANWNVDLDNADGDDDPATGVDDFWDFGDSNQYPSLKADMDGDGVATAAEFGDQPPVLTPMPMPEPRPAPGPNGVYDADGDRLIEISTLEQLDAVRYDINGNGIPEHDGSEQPLPLRPSHIAYAAAFPTGPDEEVCDGGCTGYELVRSLDFNDAGSYASGAVNASWTAGGGWVPIPVFRDNAILEGNGNTIANLYINRPDAAQNFELYGNAGLFSVLRGTVRNLGLVDVNVNAAVADVGGLAGDAGRRKPSVSNSYVTGSVSGIYNVGGLLGMLYADGASIRDSRFSGTVSSSGEGGSSISVGAWWAGIALIATMLPGPSGAATRRGP